MYPCEHRRGHQHLAIPGEFYGGVSSLPENNITIVLIFSVLPREHKFAILSTLRESLLVEFLHDSVAEVTETSFPGILRGTPTLAAGNMVKRLSDTAHDDSDIVVQITAHCVVAFNASTRLECSRWTPRGSEIVAGSINPTQICVALQGGDVILLHLDHDVLQQRYAEPVSLLTY